MTTSAGGATTASTAPTTVTAGPPEETAGFDGETITIGLVTDNSGPVKPIATQITQGAQVYWDYVNQELGGVGGKYQVAQKIADNGYDPQKSVQAYQQVKDDVVMIGNNDLASFSGWCQHDPRYQDAIIKVHDAALKYGKYYGNAGQQYLSGYTVSGDTRMVQNGPACDGWRPAGRGRGTSSAEEPVVGLPAGQKPAARAAEAIGDRASCWP